MNKGLTSFDRAVTWLWQQRLHVCHHYSGTMGAFSYSLSAGTKAALSLRTCCTRVGRLTVVQSSRYGQQNRYHVNILSLCGGHGSKLEIGAEAKIHGTGAHSATTESCYGWNSCCHSISVKGLVTCTAQHNNLIHSSQHKVVTVYGCHILFTNSCGYHSG